MKMAKKCLRMKTTESTLEKGTRKTQRRKMKKRPTEVEKTRMAMMMTVREQISETT